MKKPADSAASGGPVSGSRASHYHSMTGSGVVSDGQAKDSIMAGNWQGSQSARSGWIGL